MATKPNPKPAAPRRALPPARAANPQYEIVFRKTVSAGSLLRGLVDAARDGLSWGAGILGAAYAGGARVVLERFEAVEDAAAERRHRAHAAAHPPAAPARRLAGPTHPE